MRTNIEIDDILMRRAMSISGERTKRATVEAALRLLIQTRDQAGLRRLRGRVALDGELRASRLERKGL
jgi:Arc/MetJ family transcription regulator